ncbi:MAG: PKD domain-containing protein [Saprospiraceae bacterium]|uniref:PKD domain-containing protein n=1 Tax=Candidatus Opimibacter skivensis TaxID=2982028 RepID=A0A9D7SZJ0_9BACT|nr:PKD domain-containing protein [Candidatus Opimibacter skivensis]
MSSIELSATVSFSFLFVQNDFQISVTNVSEFHTDYLWNFGNGDISHDKNLVYNYPKAGCYSISLHVSNECYKGKNTILYHTCLRCT